MRWVSGGSGDAPALLDAGPLGGEQPLPDVDDRGVATRDVTLEQLDAQGGLGVPTGVDRLAHGIELTQRVVRGRSVHHPTSVTVNDPLRRNFVQFVIRCG